MSTVSVRRNNGVEVVVRRYAKIVDAAEYLQVKPATVRVMIADGRLTG